MNTSVLEFTWELTFQKSSAGYHKNYEYLQFAAMIISSLALTYYISRRICESLFLEFRALSEQKKADYLSRIIAILHAVLVTALSFYAVFFMW
jgi:hypothetical protein